MKAAYMYSINFYSFNWQDFRYVDEIGVTSVLIKLSGQIISVWFGQKAEVFYCFFYSQKYSGTSFRQPVSTVPDLATVQYTS